MGHAISVFGLGYVGSVTATCLAHKGNRVIGVDRNEMKVAAIAAGQSPIVEMQVKELAAKAHAAGFLGATTNTDAAIGESEISFISVGTPSLRNGNLDLSSVQQVCNEIGHALRSKNTFHWIVLRSTVLPGTTESVVIPALEAASGKKKAAALKMAAEYAKKSREAKLRLAGVLGESGAMRRYRSSLWALEFLLSLSPATRSHLFDYSTDWSIQDHA